MTERIVTLHFNAKDLSGQRFGRLVAKYPVRIKPLVIHWVSLCDCGIELPVTADSLVSGNTKSCGCLKAEATTIIHGRFGEPIYRSWAGMVGRCTNKRNDAFSDYGGRGITVCPEWREFECFLADMGEKPSSKHSIDRIDNSLGYYKENCRWATAKEQARNRRSSRILTFVGLSFCVAEWVEITGMRCIKYRAERGWSDDRIFTQPVRLRGTGRNPKFRSPAEAVYAIQGTLPSPPEHQLSYLKL